VDTNRRPTKAADEAASSGHGLTADTVGEVLVQTDPEGVIRYISAQCRLLGYEPHEMIGAHGLDLLHPEDLARARRARKSALAGEPPPPAELRRYRFRCKTGCYRWLEANPIRRADQDPSAGLSIRLRDVTEEVTAENSLGEDERYRASEARYRLIAENVRDIVVATNKAAEIDYVSPSCRRLGYAPAELIGRPVTDLVQSGQRRRYLDNRARCLAGERMDGLDHRFRFVAKDGTCHWFQGNPTLLTDEAGAPAGVINSFRDVSDQRAAEVALAESEARYRLVADNMRDLVVQTDAEGRLVYASPSCSALGYEPEDLVGRLGADFIHPDDRAGVLETIRQLRSGGLQPGWQRRCRLLQKDGGHRWYEANPSPIADADGAVVGVVNVLRDASEQMAAEDALANSEARYRVIAETMRDIVIQLDADDRLVYISPSCRELGYTQAEMIGRRGVEFVHPEDRPSVIETVRTLKATGCIDTRRERRRRLLHKDGSWRWYEGSPSNILDASGKIVGLINILRDVHAQRAADEALAASEARYRLLADNMSDMIVCSGRDGMLTFVSGAAEQIIGYTPGEMVGTNAAGYVHPEDLEDLRKPFRAALKTGPGGGAFHAQYRCLRKDGTYVWLEAHPRAFFDDNGCFIEFQDVVRDITDHKELEEDLRQARNVADTAAKAKADFLADMGHELRGPLISVRNLAHVAQARPLAEPIREYFQRIEEASRGVLVLVDDILEFSKLEAAQVVFRPRPVRLAAFAEACLAQIEPQAHAKNLVLDYIGQAPDDLVLSFDHDRLRQVVLNLVGNAVKFTNRGRISLETAYDAPAQTLTMKVWDTGPGIPVDLMSHLFQRFSQVGDGGMREHGGAGLGLAISKQIVDGMGGSIGVTSQAGRGSCFWLQVPAPVSTARDVEPESPVQQPRIRILVADGEAGLGDIVADWIGSTNAEVVSAADGEAALRLAARESFDVILMSMALPGKDGRTALRQLRGRRGPNLTTPVLALAGPGDDYTPETVMDEGFVGLVSKPMSKIEVVSAVIHALALARGAAAASGPVKVAS
jgi:PAS domain S-box-containing protein